MKRILLLFCVCPLFVCAQEIYDEHRFLDVLLSSRSHSEPLMRSSPLPHASLDSTYAYENTFGDDFLIAKYAYEFDNENIMKIQKRGYSGDIELYRVHSTFDYEPRKYFWTERIDSVYERNRYTSKSKFTRTYNEEAHLIDYRQYESNYDSPWGEALQIYSAVGFNEDNMPIVFMDTVTSINENLTIRPYIVHRWNVYYSGYSTVDSITSYVESGDRWIPELKYVISYDELWPDRTVEVFTKKDGEWTEKVGELFTKIDGRSNKALHQKKNEKGEMIQSYRFDHFYNENTVSNEGIIGGKVPEISLDNSRMLTVNLNGTQKGYVAIVNASGQIMLNQSVNQETSVVSLASLRPGYYIVSVRTATQNKSQAVILP